MSVATSSVLFEIIFFFMSRESVGYN